MCSKFFSVNSEKTKIPISSRYEKTGFALEDFNSNGAWRTMGDALHEIWVELFHKGLD